MIKETLSSLVQDVIDGNENPLKAFAILKEVEKHTKKCLAQINADVLNEANKYDEKTFSDAGYTFEKRNGSARYDFSNIEQHAAIKSDLKALEEKCKQAYRSWQKGITAVDEETGEVIPQPKVTYSSDVLILKSNK